MKEIKYKYWDKKTESWEQVTVVPPLGTEFRLYTGLKDKNGVSICEGEIIHHLKYGGNWVVVWNAAACGFSLKGKRGNLMHLTRLCEPNIQVIGNAVVNTKAKSLTATYIIMKELGE